MGATPAAGRRTALAAAAVALGVGGVTTLAVAAARQVPDPPQVAVTAPAPSGPVVAQRPTSTSQPPTSVPLTSAPPAQPSPPAPGRATPAPEPLPRSAPVRVSIPAIGVDAPIVRLGLDRDGAMEVPDGPDPVGWYVPSPTPGSVGPAILAAHVTFNGARGAFFDLATLRAGQRIRVDRADGTRATFAVRQVAQYPKADFPTLEVYGNTPEPTLRLITCAGPFDADAHYYPDNVVVYADLLPPGS